MRFTLTRKPLRRIWSYVVKSSRGFLSTEQLLPLTLDDICGACPLSSIGRNGREPEPINWEMVHESRKRHFAALLQSYLGKPGDEEIKRLYSYLRRCEEHYLHGLAQTGLANTARTGAGSVTRAPEGQGGTTSQARGCR